MIKELEQRSQYIRREALTRRILDTLRHTAEVDPVWGDIFFTDASIRTLAPLVEAIDILEAIIWASDLCMGHSQCVHSMEPWKRARALLYEKWEADMDPSLPSWPNPNDIAPKRS
jgi:hypothetical protein